MKPFEKTTYVSFELSNICPYSWQHAACPITHREEPKTVLPMEDIIETLRDLRYNDFNGRIGWNIYNEPLCDPRLFLLILQARAMLSNHCTEMFVLSNGFYLDQTIVTELEQCSVDRLRVSCYSKEEYARISKFTAERMLFEPFMAALDDRAKNYTRPERDPHLPCLAPLDEICIYSDGSVALCCMDYNRSKVFGNIKTEKLSVIVNKGEMAALRCQLEKGIRELPLCKRCGYSR